MPNDLSIEIRALLECADISVDKHLGILRQLPRNLTSIYGSTSFINVIAFILSQCQHSSSTDERLYWKALLSFVGASWAMEMSISSAHKANTRTFLHHKQLLGKLAITAARGRHQSLFWGTEVVYRLSLVEKLPLPSLRARRDEDLNPFDPVLPCIISKRILDFLNVSDLQTFGRCSRHCAMAAQAHLVEVSIRDVEEYRLLTYSMSTSMLEAYLSTYLESRQATERCIRRADMSHGVRELMSARYHLRALSSRAMAAASRQHDTVKKYACRLVTVHALTVNSDKRNVGENLFVPAYLFLEACRVLAAIQYDFVEWSQELLYRVDTVLRNG